MKLSADNLNVDVDDGKVIIEPQYVEYLREFDYRIDGIAELHAVESSSGDGGHIVAKIQTYDRPTTDDEYLDYPVDVWVCDCWNFRQEQSADLSEMLAKPSQSDACKHIEDCSKVKRAENDDQQDTLV